MLNRGLRRALRVALALTAALSVVAPTALAEPSRGAAGEGARPLSETLEKVGGMEPESAAVGGLLAIQAEQGTRERFVEVVLAQPARSHSGIERWDENNNKYTRWYGLNDAWCGMFVDWCAREAGVSEDVIPHGIAYMPTLKNHFLGGSNWHDWTYHPSAGDLVMYSDTGADDDAGHVGIVTGADGSRFYTREGNRGDDWVVDDSWAYGTRWTGYGGSMSYIDGFISPSFTTPPSVDDFDFGPNVTLPAGDGTYTICSTLNESLYLDGGGGSTENGANVMLWPGDGDEPQRRWVFTHNDDGTYTIARYGTNKVLDVSGISPDDGANVHIWEGDGGDNQRWYVQDCGNGVYALKAKHSGKFLDATDAVPHEGTNIQQWHGWANDAVSHQKFIISLSFGPRVSLPEGDGTYTICSTLNKDLYLDGGGGSTENGANVMLWPGDGDEPQRRWDFSRNDDGTYTIARHGTKKVLDVSGISSDNGANVHIWQSDGGEGQRWWLEDCGNGVYALKAKHSGKFLDATDAVPHEGTNIQQWHGWANDAVSHQKFIISPSYGPRASLPYGDGTYTICSILDKGLYLDGGGGSTANAANAMIWPGDGDEPQRRWDFSRNDDGTYTIRRHGTNKALDVYGSWLDDGANVYIWEDVGGSNQRWWLEDCGDGIFALKAKHSGKFLDVSGGVAKGGTNVHQWRGNFGQAQRFVISPSYGPSVKLPSGSGSEGVTYTISTSLEPNVFVGAAGTGAANGDNGELFMGADRPQCHWDIKRNDDGTYTIWRSGTSKVLGVSGITMADGANVHLWEIVGGDNQRWWMEDCGNGCFALKSKYSGKFLDLSGGAADPGTNVHQWQGNFGKAQQFRIAPAIDLRRDGWVDLGGGEKGYARGGRLVTGWMDLGASKYWFDARGRMAAGWTDVEVSGKAMHYYFNPASGNLARGTWMTIDGRKYYFRESGNLATGWATISDSGVDKKYYFGADGQMLTGWQDIVVNGKSMRYYFRPSGAMATGWATIDGEKYWFRPSGNMATGWADVDDAYKRYFDSEGHMLTGWQRIGSGTYYFRSSGAMQTGKATIDGVAYEFSASGTLKAGTPPTLSAQGEEPIQAEEDLVTSELDDSDGGTVKVMSDVDNEIEVEG